MSVPAIRRSTIESKTSHEVEIQALADVSFHRVWWKRRWVLWFDEPFAFEKHRPWSHGSLPRQALVGLVCTTAALWALTGILGTLGLLIAAIVTSAATVALGAAITRAEMRFWAWWTHNDGRGALDGFRRPGRLHMAVTTSEDALQALSDVGDPAALAEDFALEHARWLAGWRTYGTAGWVRLSDIADTEPLLELHSATSQWRALNESWTDEAEWEATFTGRAPELSPRSRRRRFLERLRGDDEDPLLETSTRLRTAARSARRSLEKAASSGFDKARGLSSTTNGDQRTRSVLPMMVIAPLLAAAAVFGITLVNTPGLAGQLFPDVPAAAPADRSNEAPSENQGSTPVEEERPSLSEWLGFGDPDPQESGSEPPSAGDPQSSVDEIMPASPQPGTLMWFLGLAGGFLVPLLGMALIFGLGMWAIVWGQG